MTTKTKDLIETLKTLKKVVPRRSSTHHLQNIAIMTDDLGLRVQATDIDTTLTKSILVSQDFSKKTYLVEPSDLIDFLSCSDDAFVEFKETDSKLQIITDKMTKDIDFSLDAQSAWPNMTRDLESNFTIDLSNLESVSKAMSDDELRYHLRGVYFDSKLNALVATDGHRLHKASVNGLQDSFIMPCLVVDLLKKETSAKFSRLVDKYIKITLENGLEIITREVEAKYPNWPQFVPQKFQHEITGQTEDLTKALTKGLKLSDKKSHAISFKSTSLKVKSVTLALQCSNTSDIELGFNASYLLDALKCVTSDETSIEYNDKLSPALIQCKDFTAVVMPMRV